MAIKQYTLDFHQVSANDIEHVGGKNASLGEMIQHLASADILVPHGFATTTEAFRDFLGQADLDQRIYSMLDALDVEDIAQLTTTGKAIREMILQTPFSPEFEQAIHDAYQKLSKSVGRDAFTVAVRSSATAEDLPNASFAGQQETYLNIEGIENILSAMKQVFASLFNDRAIAYRVHHGFIHRDVALSVGVQHMIRSDLAVSGVMFTLDTESGFDEVVFITSAYGLGEMVVQGAVNPDEFYVHKPSLKNGRPATIRRTLGGKALKMVYAEKTEAAGILGEKSVAANETVRVEKVPAAATALFSLTDTEVEELARHALTIESHFGRPMDIEWAKDGVDQRLYILQARPETIQRENHARQRERYTLSETGKILAEGRSIGQKIGQGCARVIDDPSDMSQVKVGDVLVAEMTDPDWEPVMKRAAAIVTNRGGRTCHAAIVARELGIPAVVGCGDATRRIPAGQPVTVSCAEGSTGYVYEGQLAFERTSMGVDKIPELPLKIMLNVGNPERAFSFQGLPNAGVGLARLEFLISNSIGIHPKALLEFDSLEDVSLKEAIHAKTAAYASPVEYYIERLKEGVATIASAFYPKPVIVRFSDFKSNEYANLLGGKHYEPIEENPMLGYRGASRYVSPEFMDCFALECQAIRRVREEMGLSNVEVMIPFVRTVAEAAQVIEVLATNGLERGKHGLRILMMCELPSNALLAKEFLAYFDGFSIGTNDLTQLTLGLDRDSSLVAAQFDERNDAVKILLHQAIQACKAEGKYVGLCGQGPSDHADFAKWLMQEGIDSISLNPDSVLDTYLFLAKQLPNELPELADK
ncbi:MAG: phosphoenolpyruvate synthase [Legionella sp.]|nr:phosphoenolpyruvate synthase [Legionella sp.]